MTFSGDVNPASRPRPLLHPVAQDLASVAQYRVDQAIEVMIDTIAGNLYEEYGDNETTEKVCRDAVLDALWWPARVV